MPKFFSFLLILFITLPGFAQGELKKDPLTPGGGRVIIRSSLDHSPTEQVPLTKQADPVTEESVVDEVEQDHNKQVEQFKKIEKVTAPVLKPRDPMKVLKSVGSDQVTLANLLDDKVLADLQSTIKAGTLSKMSDEQIKKHILEQARGKIWEKLFIKFPKLLDIAADILRDQEALPGLIAIMVRKNDLKDFTYVCLAIFVFGLFIKHRLVKPKWSFGKRFVWSMGFNLFSTVLTFIVFYTFFSAEITPTLAIISKRLF